MDCLPVSSHNLEARIFLEVVKIRIDGNHVAGMAPRLAWMREEFLFFSEKEDLAPACTALNNYEHTSGDMRPHHYYVVAALALTAATSLREAFADCKVKRMEAGGCMFDVVCYAEMRDDVPLPADCAAPARARIRLALRSGGPPLVRRLAFLGDVRVMIAAGNKWGRLPLDVLGWMPHLHGLQLPDNLISSLPRDAFSNRTELRSLDLSLNSIAELHVDTFAHTPNLERLYLARNRIADVRGGTFAAQKALELLDLSHNSLMRLNSDAFRGLDKLKTLRLNHNTIVTLNGALKHLCLLKHLYLRENKLHRIDLDEVPNFWQLQTLDFTNNTLSSIQPDLFRSQCIAAPEKLSRLQSTTTNPVAAFDADDEPTAQILLSGNKIATLENASFVGFVDSEVEVNLIPMRQNTAEMTKTAIPTEIDLSFNMIDTIEFDAFQGIAKLTKLDISWNRLTIFYINNTHLNQLVHLNLQNNYINAIDMNTFRNLGRMTSIDISGNKILHLPKHTSWAPRDLIVLNLSNNAIAKLNASQFGERESLRVLDVSRNELAEVYMDGAHLGSLTKLFLQANNIADMSVVRLEYLLELTFLDLSVNRIERLPRSALAHLHALRHLNLSCNSISDVEPSTFASMRFLSTLDLSGNNLTRIHYGAFSGLGELESLSLSHNRIAYVESRALFDLRALRRLQLEHNGLRAMDVDVWKGRKASVALSVGGNRLGCAWVASALTDARQGWSGAWLTARGSAEAPARAVGGIACVDDEDAGGKEGRSSPTSVDDRLLYTNQKILNAILVQTDQLKKSLNKLSYSHLRAVPLRYRGA